MEAEQGAVEFRTGVDAMQMHEGHVAEEAELVTRAARAGAVQQDQVVAAGQVLRTGSHRGEEAVGLVQRQQMGVGEQVEPLEAIGKQLAGRQVHQGVADLRRALVDPQHAAHAGIDAQALQRTLPVQHQAQLAHQAPPRSTPRRDAGQETCEI